MLRTTLPAVLGAALGSATLVLAQSPPPPPAQTNPPARRTDNPPATAPQQAGQGQAYRVKQVLGSKVSIQGNVGIGTVDDIVFGDDGQVEYLIVANEGKLVTVPWEAAKFNFQQQTATIDITQEKFKAIPTYTVQEYPNYALPAYRTEIYRLYGVTPRERRIERRIERRP
jgi:hypothetical protein